MTDHAEKWLAIAECNLCDDHGTRHNQLHRCDHIDYAAISKRGIQLCLQALKEAKQ